MAMPQGRCSCGFSRTEDEELIDHLLTVFSPPDDTAGDGREHYEADPRLTCPCGFTADTAEEMDDHFLRVFTPVDSIGRDGARHVPVP